MAKNENENENINEPEAEKLLPSVPVLSEYSAVKTQLTAKINKLNSIQYLTDENKKEVKNGIAEINKVKDRISRYRIDETNRFLAYIQPYIDKCKELEKLCTDGLGTIKSKVKELEDKEREEKTTAIKNMFNFVLEQERTDYTHYLKFDMVFNDKWANKTASMPMIEKEMTEWIKAKSNDIKFINLNVDEPSAVLNIYLGNGLNLTAAIEEYQARFANEAEIKATMAAEASENVAKVSSFEKKLDIVIKIKQLPQSKVKALQSFLDSLNVEFDVEVG